MQLPAEMVRFSTCSPLSGSLHALARYNPSLQMLTSDSEFALLIIASLQAVAAPSEATEDCMQDGFHIVHAVTEADGTESHDCA
jgi:hypothetical protein